MRCRFCSIREDRKRRGRFSDSSTSSCQASSGRRPIALAWAGFGYWALVWREVIRSALLTAGMWLCFPWVPGWPCRKTSVREMLGFGAHLSAANIVATISSSIDRLLIGRFWGAGPVALYRQAYQLLVVPMDQLLGI